MSLTSRIALTRLGTYRDDIDFLVSVNQSLVPVDSTTNRQYCNHCLTRINFTNYDWSSSHKRPPPNFPTDSLEYYHYHYLLTPVAALHDSMREVLVRFDQHRYRFSKIWKKEVYNEIKKSITDIVNTHASDYGRYTEMGKSLDQHTKDSIISESLRFKADMCQKITALIALLQPLITKLLPFNLMSVNHQNYCPLSFQLELGHGYYETVDDPFSSDYDSHEDDQS